MVKDEEVSIISAENIRSGLSHLDKQKDINLILVNTHHPNSSKNALMLLNPSSDFSTDANDETLYLSKPFTKEQFTSFIKHNTNQDLKDFM